MSNQVAHQLKISDVVAEYEEKKDSLQNALDSLEKCKSDLMVACTVKGEYGRTQMKLGDVSIRKLKENLLKSAWWFFYRRADMDIIMTAKDKKLFEQAMADPPEFTVDNIRATFGEYLLNPMDSILRGLAEVFCQLDPAYKSHEKVKIGVKGLPKRIIIPNVGGYGWGRELLTNVINALAAYQGKPLVSAYKEISAMIKDGDYLKDALSDTLGQTVHVGYDVWLKTYHNGNGHLYFGDIALADINRALGEYYGEVLPDAYTDKPDKKETGTAVSKDLQYYATPKHVAESIVYNNEYYFRDAKVLEPSCGCGKLMDAIKSNSTAKYIYGIEYDANRAEESRQKGYPVLTANFLETVPTGDFDVVMMNPPFYGHHYLKHIEHALKFLKDDGVLISILPSTARYDHGLIDKLPYKRIQWTDLPTGSFRESGTNVSTSYVVIRK